jgi:hypothetical protein
MIVKLAFVVVALGTSLSAGLLAQDPSRTDHALSRDLDTLDAHAQTLARGLEKLGRDLATTRSRLERLQQERDSARQEQQRM